MAAAVASLVLSSSSFHFFTARVSDVQQAFGRFLKLKTNAVYGFLSAGTLGGFSRTSLFYLI
jgi:hypothetical protein